MEEGRICSRCWAGTGCPSAPLLGHQCSLFSGIQTQTRTYTTGPLILRPSDWDWLTAPAFLVLHLGFSCPASPAWHPCGWASLCDWQETWKLRGGIEDTSPGSPQCSSPPSYSWQQSFTLARAGSFGWNGFPPTRIRLWRANDGARNEESETWSSFAQALRSGAVWSSSCWRLARHLGDGSGPCGFSQFLCTLSNCSIALFCSFTCLSLESLPQLFRSPCSK